MATIVRLATKADLSAIERAMQSVGLHVQKRDLERYYFDVTEQFDANVVCGGFVIWDDFDGCVGFQGLTPVRLTLAGESFVGYQMGVTGVLPKYGAYLMDLMVAVSGAAKGKFLYANTANAKSVKIGKVLLGMNPGPVANSRIQYAILSWAGFFVAALQSKTRRIPSLAKIARALLLPLVVVDRILGKMAFLSLGKCAIESDFSKEDFDVFCERFQRTNRGLCTQRTSVRLRRCFSDALRTGECVLLVRRDETSSVLGYVVLHRRTMANAGVIRYEILDICSADMSETTISELLCDAKRYSRMASGVLLEYVGAPREGVAHVFTRQLAHNRAAVSNTFEWATEIPALQEAFRRNDGWFYGPYDGDRCNSRE